MGNVIAVPDQVRASFTGELVSPADPGYDQIRRVHNGLIDKRPGLIARCRTIPDIVDAVRIGRDQATENVRFHVGPPFTCVLESHGLFSWQRCRGMSWSATQRSVQPVDQGRV